MRFPRLHSLMLSAAVCGGAMFGGEAVAQSRNSRTGPDASYNVPTAGLSAPLLNFSVGLGGINSVGNPTFPDMLTSDALEVMEAHNWARQQTLLCLMYLRANKEQILAGNDEMYNSVFGTFYDRSNPFASSYTIDDSHYNQVVSTFATMRNLLETQTTLYQYGTSGQTDTGDGWSLIFGYDRGERQWGYSTSASRDHYNDIFVANNGQPVFPPRRWDNDNAPDRGNATADTRPQRSANSVDRPFFFEKLDIYGNPDDPNTQNLGNIFFFNPDPNAVTDFRRLLGERATLALNPVTGELTLSSAFGENGDLEFNITQLNNEIFRDFNSILPNVNRFNSGQGFIFVDDDLDGIPDTDTNGNFLIDIDTVPIGAFSTPRFRQFQMIMMSFAEFTTTLGDPRGGAFVGVGGLLRVLDPTGRASVFGESLEARNYARFTEVLNEARIVDPRVFPPAGKNTAAFNPAIPSS